MFPVVTNTKVFNVQIFIRNWKGNRNIYATPYLPSNLWKFSLSSLPVQYHSTVTNNALGIVENRLVFYEPVAIAINKHYRIIVPISLIHTLFSLFHASPATSHVREYKNLYRIKLCFFWPNMRFKIHRWIKQCPHYRLIFCWCRWGQEVVFSFVLTFGCLVNILIVMVMWY